MTIFVNIYKVVKYQIHKVLNDMKIGVQNQKSKGNIQRSEKLSM